MRAPARPPCARARAWCRGRVLARKRRDRLQPLALVVAVERMRAGRQGDRRRVPEHAHHLVPEGRGSELEAVVVGRAAHEREMLVDAREGRREQEAIALLLPRPVTRQAGRRERAPQLGRARGLGGLPARKHTLLEPAQHQRAYGREPGQADADDADAPPRQPVAQAHLHGIQCRQYVVAVGLRDCLAQLVRGGGGRSECAARRHARPRLGEDGNAAVGA